MFTLLDTFGGLDWQPPMERVGNIDPSPDPIRHPLASGLVTGANVSPGGAGLATQPPLPSTCYESQITKAPTLTGPASTFTTFWSASSW